MTLLLKRIVKTENEPYLSLYFEISDGERTQKKVLVIPEGRYFELKLKKGEISEELFDILENDAKECAAYRRGIGILAYGANSSRMLERKLRQRGFDGESARSAVGRLNEEGFIDESSDAARLAESCAKKLWGERRIIAHLREKGYGNEAIYVAKDALAEVDFTENCRKLIEKKYKRFPKDKKEAEKAIAALIRYGYSLSQIKSASTKSKEAKAKPLTLS